MPVGAIVGAAAVGAGATVYASGQAAKTAKNAAKANQQIISDTQKANTALMQPYVQSGTKATGAIEAFLGLNGSASQDEAFQKWRDSTGYKFTRDQGLDAINSNLALRNQLKSGTAMKSAQQYGTNLANQFGQQYLGNLQNQQGVGLSAAGATAGYNSQAASGQTANNQWLAGVKGDNAMTQANAFNNFLNTATKTYGTSLESSFGAKQIKPQGDDGGYSPISGIMSGARPVSNPYGNYLSYDRNDWRMY